MKCALLLLFAALPLAAGRAQQKSAPAEPGYRVERAPLTLPKGAKGVTRVAFFNDGRAVLCTGSQEVFVCEPGAPSADEAVVNASSPLRGVAVSREDVYLAKGAEVIRIPKGGEPEPIWRGSDGAEPFDPCTEATGALLFATKNGEQTSRLVRIAPDSDRVATADPGAEIAALAAGNYGEVGFVTPRGAVEVVRDWKAFHAPGSESARTEPLCWIQQDESAASPVLAWAPDDQRWGPWRNRLIVCTGERLLGIVRNEFEDPALPDCCDQVAQGAAISFPIKLPATATGAAFNPKDGQLYVAAGGILYRVVYAGGNPEMPIDAHFRKEGLEVRFSCSLNTQSACDPENWTVTALDPASAVLPMRLDTKSIFAGTDDASVSLEIPKAQPAKTLSVRYHIKSSSGDDLTGDLSFTVRGFEPQ